MSFFFDIKAVHDHVSYCNPNILHYSLSLFPCHSVFAMPTVITGFIKDFCLSLDSRNPYFYVLMVVCSVYYFSRKKKVILYYSAKLMVKFLRKKLHFYSITCALFRKKRSSICLMKCSNKTLKNLPYFWNTKTQVVFFVFQISYTIYFPLMNMLTT